MKVTIVEYTPTWRELFEQERCWLQTAVGEVACVIEHVGSTAIAGLAAKPVIDIMIGLHDFSTADTLVPKIEALGYEYDPRPEDIMPHRRYFRKSVGGTTLYQMHVVEIGSEFWERLLIIRDFLRVNPHVAYEYAALKKRLAEREWNNMKEYADAKVEFIMNIVRMSREQAEQQRQHDKLLDPTTR